LRPLGHLYNELKNGVHPDTAKRNLQQALADANSRMRRLLQSIDQRIKTHRSYEEAKSRSAT